ncbi:MAG: hypothetical protein M3137_20065 [Actinomycetota bacterium]|nr:hypothetical protein [Actinomycetota bacterium]
MALVCTIECCARNNRSWTPPGNDDGKETAAVIWDLAAGPAGVKEIGAVAACITDRWASP